VPLKSCPRYHAIAHRAAPGGREVRAIALPCKSWGCPACARKKAKKYRDMLEHLWYNKQLWFVTLTFLHNQQPREAWASAAGAWNRLRLSLTRTIGRFAYVRILESHNTSSYPHYHIVVTAYPGTARLGDLAKKAGFGWQIRVARINSVGIGGYLSKYMVKPWSLPESQTLRRLLRLRIFSTSRGLLYVQLQENPWRLVHGFLSNSSNSPTLHLICSHVNGSPSVGPPALPPTDCYIKESESPTASYFYTPDSFSACLA
jgi:hypothetical protein